MYTKLFAVTLISILALTLFGCSALPQSIVGARSSVELTAIDGRGALHPTLPTRIYRFVDDNTADIILTDLSLEDLTSDAALPASGQIVHVQLFIRPRPGRTPIERTACSASLRYAVLARGEAGIYAGAGFLVPESVPGGSLFGGSMTRSPVRLVRATAQFVDLLGPAEADVSFIAKRDDDTVTRWVNLMDRLALIGKQVEEDAVAP
jgi:hypothetical protein